MARFPAAVVALIRKLPAVKLVKQNSFVLTVIALSLLCFALASVARADVKGIPRVERFASASFPHARTVSGCTEWRRPDRLADQWGPVSFAGACQAHDQCFHTLGTSWAACNQEFLKDLQASCDRDLATERLTKGRSGTPDAQAVKLCYEIVNLYVAKVQDKDVARRFELAQRQTRDYLAYVKSVVNDVFKSVLNRSASAQEQDQALKTLESDYTLDDLKAALMGQRLDQDAVEPMPVIDRTAEVEAFSVEALPVIEKDRGSM